MPFTNRELESQYWLALTAHRQARDLGAFAMLAVMQVAMERVFDTSGRWPDSLPEVCAELQADGDLWFLGDNTMALELAGMTMRRHVGPGHGLAFHHKKPTAYRAIDSLTADWARGIQIDPQADVEFIGEVGRYVFYRS